MGYTVKYGFIQVANSVNGPWTSIPVPAKDGCALEISTIVDSARNAVGSMIGNTVGDDKVKLTLNYPPLPDADFRNLLVLFDREHGGAFKKYVKFWDPRVGTQVIRLMYVGDRSGKPYFGDSTSGKPEYWTNVKANLVEV